MILILEANVQLHVISGKQAVDADFGSLQILPASLFIPPTIMPRLATNQATNKIDK